MTTAPTNVSVIHNHLVELGYTDVAFESEHVVHAKRKGKSVRGFVKYGTGGDESADVSALACEAEGLRHLQGNTDVVVPQPWTVCSTDDKRTAIVLDFLDVSNGGRARALALTRLAQGLANIHLAPPKHTHFGFPSDGCCGANQQPNNSEARSLNWMEFWREYRLGFQLEMFKHNFPEDEAFHELGMRLMSTLPDVFSDIVVEDIGLSCLHGDLWAGNWAPLNGGSAAAVFDPACYYGHHEADLGIMHMFGGFPASFFETYHKFIPKAPGFEKRSILYELHHHLNHCNIFGLGYRRSALQLMQELTGSCG